MKEIKGDSIISFRTLKTIYDGDCIEVRDDLKNEYRIKVSEFLKIVNELRFRVVWKRVHAYLGIIEIDDEKSEQIEV